MTVFVPFEIQLSLFAYSGVNDVKLMDTFVITDGQVASSTLSMLNWYICFAPAGLLV